MSRARFHTQVETGLQARARAAVRGVSHAARVDYTLAQLTEDALERYLPELEELYNDGRPWTPDDRPLRRGQRLGREDDIPAE